MRDLRTPWTHLLQSTIPEETDSILLRAALWEGAAAGEQWGRWIAEVGSPKNYFEREWVGRKGLLAFIGERLSHNEIEVPAELATYFRVARVREELRSRIFIDVMTAVLDPLAGEGISPALLNGAAYAFTVYPEPLTRHNHGIDLLVRPSELERTRRVVCDVGFQAAGSASAGLVHEYRHDTGLALTVRSALFCIPHSERDPTEFLARSREVEVYGRPVRILSSEDRLCHTLIEGASASTRRNLRWVCDAFLSLESELESESLDFERVASSATGVGGALQVAVLLEYLRSDLSVSIPGDVVETLIGQGEPETREAEVKILSAALRTSKSAQAFLSRARCHPAISKKALRFAVLPSAQHMRYQFGVARTRFLPWLYLSRGQRYLRRLFA